MACYAHMLPIFPELRGMITLCIQFFRNYKNLCRAIVNAVPAALAPVFQDFHCGFPFEIFIFGHIPSSIGMLGEGINAYIKNIAV